MIESFALAGKHSWLILLNMPFCLSFEPCGKQGRSAAKAITKSLAASIFTKAIYCEKGEQVHFENWLMATSPTNLFINLIFSSS